jgi:uncharacterized protein YcfJ
VTLKSILTKAGLSAATAASLMIGVTPTMASAQPYDDRYYDNGRSQYYDQRDYDCDRRRDSNTVGGAVVGGILGAVIGSNVAARGNRHEGTAAGAVGGAVLGGAIGRSGTECRRYRESDSYRYRRYAYGDDSYAYGGGYRRHYDRGYYDRSYDDRGYYDEDK